MSSVRASPSRVVQPLDLAGDVALALAEVAEPGGLEVDGVELDEHVPDVAAQRRRLLLGSGRRPSSRRGITPSTRVIT